MILLVTIAVVGLAIWLLRRPKAAGVAPVRHFGMEEQRDGFFVFNVPRTEPGPPALLIAMIPGFLVAVAVETWWLRLGHDLDRGGGLFFAAWAVGSALFWPVCRKRAQRHNRATHFTVGHGCVLLSNNDMVPILGQYVLTRRNTAAYGAPATYTNRLELGVDGVTYVLADAMNERQATALYHEVARRLRGDP